MKTKLLTAMAIVLLSSGLAQAAWTAEEFARSYTALGYTRVEVKMLAGVAKVEAFKAGAKLEVIHDITTGAVLKREKSVARVGESTTPGVFVRTDVRGSARDDDWDDHDDSFGDDDDHDDGHRGRGGGRDD